MNAKIICIGDELLIGQTINTNAAWIGEFLFEYGVKVVESVCIADTKPAILHSLGDISRNIELVLITGGLGPTIDDITKNVLCEYFETTLEKNDNVLKHITDFFSSRNKPMLASNIQQAYLPKKATILPNKIGTAAGMWFEKNGIVYVSMPGVPSEMKGLMKYEVLPRIVANGKLPIQYYKTVMTQGIGESFLVEKIIVWQEKVLNMGFKLAYLPSAGQVRIRIGGEGSNIEILKNNIQQLVNELEQLVPSYVFGYDKQTMQEVVGLALTKLKKTLGTAESCTGGFLAHLITSTPGASKYYKGSLITYDNNIKTDLLGVPKEIIDEFGAVSEPVVYQMAKSVQEQLNVDYAISFSGIAGPDGGSEEKPVGMIWMALATPTGISTKRLQFGKNRHRNITMACLTALNLLRLELQKQL
ncbi:MAG: nicotinamide-nucleotide amidase [Flavobacteriales bacterium]|jgi:nicotinamide-nucleotide amidase